MTLVTFTRPDGEPFEVNPDDVEAVTASIGQAPGTLIIGVSYQQVVKEPLPVVLKKLGQQVCARLGMGHLYA